MALTATLVNASPDWLVYRIVGDAGEFPGGTITIPNAGGASPDLDTDTLTTGGPIRRIVDANRDPDGIGADPTVLVAGAMTQQQARNLLFSDQTAPIGNELTEEAVMFVQSRGQVSAWIVDADVDINGNPVVTVVSGAVPNASAYLYIKAKKSHAGEEQAPIGRIVREILL